MKDKMKKIDKFLEDHYRELGGVTLGLSIAVICKAIGQIKSGK